MLDLHCHILPGVDDGPVDLDEALALARFSVADGITHITATPHCHRQLRLLRADILPRVRHFNQELVQSGIPLTVLPGAEIQVYDCDLYRRDFEEGVYCHLGGGTEFTLLEFPWREDWVPRDAAAFIGWLRARGMTPIVAHPERHDYFRDDPGRLRHIVAAGAWIQLTVDSFLGNHGPFALRSAPEMLETYREVVLATDAHQVGGRCSGLAAGFAWVRQHVGVERANDLKARADGVLAKLLTASVEP